MTPYNRVTAARSEAPTERRDKFSDRKRVSRAQVSASELFILRHSGVLESTFTVDHPKLRFAPLRSRSSLLGRLCQALPPAREDSTRGPRGSGHPPQTSLAGGRFHPCVARVGLRHLRRAPEGFSELEPRWHAVPAAASARFPPTGRKPSSVPECPVGLR